MGTALLALPHAQAVAIPFIDLFFTATAAITTTGALTVPMDAFTSFGQLILLVLIQLGGLGIITLSVLFMSLLIGQEKRVHSMKKMIGFALTFSALVELIGFCAVAITLDGDLSFGSRIFYAFAHTISTFCNAGFVFLPQGITAYSANVPFLFISSMLIILGGLGVTAWHELLSLRRKEPLSSHTKIILVSMLTITVMGAVLLWFLEHRHALSTLSPLAKMMNVLFDAISAQSTGYCTLSLASARLSTLFVLMLMAFIGSAPGSTGSGIKTTTFVIFLATIRAVIRGAATVTIGTIVISKDQVFRALSVFALSLTWIALALFALLITDEGWNFIDLMMEVFSAFSNIGFNTGITPYLSVPGKILLTLMMLIGKIGVLTVLLTLRKTTGPEDRIIMS